MKKEERAKLNLLKSTIEYLRGNSTHYSVDMYYKAGDFGMDYTITKDGIFLVIEYFDHNDFFVRDEYYCNYDIIKYHLDNNLDITWRHDSNNYTFNFIGVLMVHEVKRLYNSTIYEIYKDRFCNIINNFKPYPLKFKYLNTKWDDKRQHYLRFNYNTKALKALVNKLSK